MKGCVPNLPTRQPADNYYAIILKTDRSGTPIPGPS